MDGFLGQGTMINRPANQGSDPAFWHFGLMAEFWSLRIDAPESAGMLQLIGQSGQPVLDLACGTGRLLVPLLCHGIDVDGIDASADMVAHPRSAAAGRGLSPDLRVQPMADLAPRRQYRTVLIVDSFGIGGDRHGDIETLRRCRSALMPGGVLIQSAAMEYTSRESWGTWLAEGDGALPAPWPDKPIERKAPDGAVLRLWIRTTSSSPLLQRYCREMRIEKWMGGTLVAAESGSLQGNMYLPSELMLLLDCAGFSKVELRDGYSARAATDATEQLVVVATAGIVT